MKTKLNLTIDKDLIPKCKSYAKARGKSVSQLVEELLREKTEKGEPTFSTKWRGQFKSVKKSGVRYEKLKKRYLS
jgi:hypothetical protein